MRRFIRQMVMRENVVVNNGSFCCSVFLRDFITNTSVYIWQVSAL